MKHTEKTLKLTPSLDDFKLFQRDVLFSSEKATRLLGFTPTVSLDTGLELTVTWLREQGFFLKYGADSSSFTAKSPHEETVQV
jgi:hypothetical protein